MNTLRRPKTVTYLPYASKTEARLLKMLFFMVFCFVVLWSPLVVYWFLKDFNQDLRLSEYFILTSEWFCRIQPVLDPIIYGYLNKEFRKNLRDMLRVCSQCSLYYATDIRMSTISGENNTPYSSDQYEDQFPHADGQFSREENGPSREIVNRCSLACIGGSAEVVSTTTTQPTTTIERHMRNVPGSDIADNLYGTFITQHDHRPHTKSEQAIITVASKETPAGSISYVSKCDPPSQRRASLTYHISGSLNIMADTRPNDDNVANRPQAPVWYLGGTFPLNSKPNRKVGRLHPIASQDLQTRPALDGQNEMNHLYGEATNTTSTQMRRATGFDSQFVKKKRKRKKILDKRIVAKKCYSSGGVYVGPTA